MPPPKQLTQETYTSLKARVVTAFTPFESQMLDDRFRAIQHFQPPPSYQAWLDATNVKGKLFGTKSRGDRLQAVDRAYKAWIEYTGEEGIVHWRNAENLANALEKYRGVVYNAGNQVSGLSHDYRDERDQKGVMSKTLSLCRLLQRLCVDSPVDSAQRRRRNRRALLVLIANIKVDWSPTTTLLFGVGGLGYGAYKLMGQQLIDIVMHDVAPVAAIAGIGYQAFKQDEAAPPSSGPSFFSKEGFKMKVDNAKYELMKFVVGKIDAFKEWAGKTFTKQFGLNNAMDVMEKIGKALAYLASYLWQEIGKFAKPANEIQASLRSLINDQWTRSNLSLQQAELVTSEGGFAMIRKGIDTGIRNRQAVAGWTIAKNAVKIGVTATASAAAAKIADLLLNGFQLIFKVAYNKIEISRIKHLIDEARTMWVNVQKAATQPEQPGMGTMANAISRTDLVPKMTTGYMPAFKAAHYTAAEFLDDSKAAYLNFLHSLVDASPVMAAIVMNSNEFKSVDDVLHAATPRSTEDVELAAKHIASLKIEAKRLYQESGFKVTPHNRSELGWADQSLFHDRITAAQLNEVVMAAPG